MRFWSNSDPLLIHLGQISLQMLLPKVLSKMTSNLAVFHSVSASKIIDFALKGHRKRTFRKCKKFNQNAMKMSPKWAPKSLQILQKSTLKRTHFSDSLFTSKMIKNDSKMRPLFSNNFHFLVLLVRIVSLVSFFFHFFVILVTSGTEFHTLTRKFMKNVRNYWFLSENINIFTLFW